MDIYLAGPLLTDAEKAFNVALATRLRAAGHVVFLPQQQCEGLLSPRDIFSVCVNGLSGSQIVVAVLDGADADSGNLEALIVSSQMLTEHLNKSLQIGAGAYG